jgi:hypothetical protein
MGKLLAVDNNIFLLQSSIVDSVKYVGDGVALVLVIVAVQQFFDHLRVLEVALKSGYKGEIAEEPTWLPARGISWFSTKSAGHGI